MNDQLIKFIALCLADNVISDKEREIIFRKSLEFGVPLDECEIILEGMIQQAQGSVIIKESVVSSIEIKSIVLSPSAFSSSYIDELNLQINKESESIREELIGLVKKSKLYDVKVKRFEEETFDFNDFILDRDDFDYVDEDNIDDYLKFNSEFRWGIDKYDIYYDLNNNFALITNFPSIYESQGFRETGRCVAEKRDLIEPRCILFIEWGVCLISRENILDLDTTIYEKNSLFKVKKMLKVRRSDGTNDDFFLIKDADILDFYKGVKDKFQTITTMYENIINDFDITELSTGISLNGEVLSYLNALEEFVKSKNDVISDILRTELISDIISSNKDNINKIEKELVFKFTQIENYLQKRRVLLLKTLSGFMNFEMLGELELLANLIIDGANELNCIFYNCIAMLNAALSNDMLTFNRIYQKLDELDVFNSKWENMMTQQLQSVNENLETVNNDLLQLNNDLNVLGRRITKELSSLQMTTKNGFSDMGISMKKVNQSLNFNNLLTGINLYQAYKINKNTSKA